MPGSVADNKVVVLERQEDPIRISKCLDFFALMPAS